MATKEKKVLEMIAFRIKEYETHSQRIMQYKAKFC